MVNDLDGIYSGGRHHVVAGLYYLGVARLSELLLFLTLTVWFEGRNQDEVCMTKIAQVALNRMGSDGDIAKVILAPAQFSWVPEKMINGVLKPEHRPNRESAAWLKSERAAKTAIYSGKFAATHFHATWMDKPKSWSKLKWLTTCDQHHFYY